MTTPKTARVVRLEAGALWYPDVTPDPRELMVVLPAAEYDRLTAQLREARRLLAKVSIPGLVLGTKTVNEVRTFLSSNTEES